MKKQICLAFATLMILFTVSCDKKKSTDLPLPNDRKASVYITTENNNLISYNPFTGVKQWEVMLNGVSDGVPVLYKKKLYVVTNAGYLYAIDIITGKIETSTLIQAITNLSMVAYNDNLYIGANDSMYCYNLTGGKVWAYGPGTQCTSSPQIANGHVYFGAGPQIHAVDATNGVGIWISTISNSIDIKSSPRVSNNLVYFGAQDKKIYALNESDGSLKWEYMTVDKITSSPLVYGGMCIIGSTDYGVYCIDTTSPSLPMQGELRWKYPTLDRVNYSSPTVHPATNTILIGSYDFNLYAIDHVTGDLKWKYPAGSIIKSSPVVYGDYVYFVSVDRYLYCVDVRNGGIVWKSFTNGSTESSPMVDDLADGQYPSNSGMSKY